MTFANSWKNVINICMAFYGFFKYNKNNNNTRYEYVNCI